MGKLYNEISNKYIKFIETQKIFFVGTAAPEGRINISPKGMDTLRILDKNRVIWLNLTGSGNETAAHIDENSRMTIMFAAFEGPPTILRLYGNAKAVYKNDALWSSLINYFPKIPGVRQIFDLKVEMVQKSCGMAVPLYDYTKDRDVLVNWASKHGDSGMKKYWEKWNKKSLDGRPTNILERNT